MDNLTLNLRQNRTQESGFSFCRDNYSNIYFMLNSILLFFGFPSTVIIIAKLLNKMYRTRSVSAAEVFLLQINFANICLFISLVLVLLYEMNVINFSFTLCVLFYSPSLTARPIFLLAMCVIFYLAIVHPVTYMATKTWLRWEWLVITLVWIYTLAVNIAIVFSEYNHSHPVFMAMFLISLPITMYFNITTVRALISRGPRNDSHTLNPAKRKAFRIILSIQVVLLMFYVPQAYFYIHLYIAPMDSERFICTEGFGIMLVSQLSEFAMPVIFLYSLCKLNI